MPVIARVGASFKPAPAGTHAAVCVDIEDMGELKVEFNGKSKMQHKVRLVWQIDEDRDDGKPFQVSKRYTLSLHEKSSLRKDLESWRGKPFTDQELLGFDIEVLLSVGCLVNVIHTSKNGQTYANVASIMKLGKGMSAPTQREYIRVCDREPTESEPVPNGSDESFNGITDDDVPF